MDPEIAQTLAMQCLGEVLEGEIGNEDGNYTQGYANRELLWQAVRDDFFTFATIVGACKLIIFTIFFK